MLKSIRNFALILFVAGASLPAAVAVNWADWTSGTAGTNGSANGTFQFGLNTVNVTYAGEIYFVTTGVDTNYWTEPNPLARPYTGGDVSNAPPASDIIAMSTPTARTLSFSEAVTDLYFAYVSLNGNGFVFNQDFEIVSQGQGHWGNGTAAKQLLGLNQFALTGTDGEPHGLLHFTGTFNSIMWTSNANETWYGFTVGAGSRAADAVAPEPSTWLMGVTALALVPFLRRRAKA